MNACFVFIIYLISTRDEQTGKIAEIMTDISDIGITGKKNWRKVGPMVYRRFLAKKLLKSLTY